MTRFWIPTLRTYSNTYNTPSGKAYVVYRNSPFEPESVDVEYFSKNMRFKVWVEGTVVNPSTKNTEVVFEEELSKIKSLKKKVKLLVEEYKDIELLKDAVITDAVTIDLSKKELDDLKKYFKL